MCTEILFCGLFSMQIWLILYECNQICVGEEKNMKGTLQQLYY